MPLWICVYFCKGICVAWSLFSFARSSQHWKTRIPETQMSRVSVNLHLGIIQCMVTTIAQISTSAGFPYWYDICSIRRDLNLTVIDRQGTNSVGNGWTGKAKKQLGKNTHSSWSWISKQHERADIVMSLGRSDSTTGFCVHEEFNFKWCYGAGDVAGWKNSYLASPKRERKGFFEVIISLKYRHLEVIKIDSIHCSFLCPRISLTKDLESKAFPKLFIELDHMSPRNIRYVRPSSPVYVYSPQAERTALEVRPTCGRAQQQ